MAMQRILIGIIATLGVTAAAHAAPASRDAPIAVDLEPVRHIPALTHFYSWSAIDNDTLVVWAAHHQPYLIELAFPSHDLRFAEAIAVSEFAGRVHSRFDSVYVRGQRYPIAEIYRLSREDAESIT
jgi:hypothetical protein